MISIGSCVSTRDPKMKLEVVAESLSVYYSPDQRATITSGLPWEKRLAWGQENRALMTRRAYSRFIVGSCAGPAVRDKAGTRALVRLLTECVFSAGCPTLVELRSCSALSW